MLYVATSLTCSALCFMPILPISCQSSLSTPPQNIRKQAVFRGYRNRPVAWNGLVGKPFIQFNLGGLFCDKLLLIELISQLNHNCEGSNKKSPRKKNPQTLNLTLSVTYPWPLTGGFFPGDFFLTPLRGSFEIKWEEKLHLDLSDFQRIQKFIT